MNLEELKQRIAPLVPPQVPDAWPPQPWLLAVLGGLLLLLVLLVLLRWYRRTHVRRYAYRELEAIQQRYSDTRDAQRYLYELNLLLRRIAVRNFRREKVAALTGEDWLDFLDWSRGRKRGDDPGFREGSGRVLAWGAYKAEPDHFDADKLQRLVRAWIRRQT
ncbi:DUF4381 domain-containing protein [Marinospirillum alkaliphilum]|uniref:DUF4381 domain-containing protein n=1 Tax=Marinospirillum alkaliphilum DSM 21637 TaxID=1122209 RepID=A0A1K1YHB0_9GAMM|nr:DUF4381 domain-containing protein [Marinospirillum alkaliphilum]SFX60757.1 protein of unknown function [Marinospirillum alkaliphilum DSM 21637]